MTEIKSVDCKYRIKNKHRNGWCDIWNMRDFCGHPSKHPEGSFTLHYCYSESCPLREPASKSIITTSSSFTISDDKKDKKVYGIFREDYDGYPSLEGILYEDDLTIDALMLFSRETYHFIDELNFDKLHHEGLRILKRLKELKE